MTVRGSAVAPIVKIPELSVSVKPEQRLTRPVVADRSSIMRFCSGVACVIPDYLHVRPSRQGRTGSVRASPFTLTPINGPAFHVKHYVSVGTSQAAPLRLHVHATWNPRVSTQSPDNLVSAHEQSHGGSVDVRGAGPTISPPPDTPPWLTPNSARRHDRESPPHGPHIPPRSILLGSDLRLLAERLSYEVGSPRGRRPPHAHWRGWNPVHSAIALSAPTECGCNSGGGAHCFT